jgi:thioredoxin-like negative regulator of GroEL
MAWARDAGALYAKLERWVDAMAVLEPFVAELDSQGLALYLMAAIEAGKAGTAIETLKEDARRRVREDPDASCAYGRALLHSKQFVEAEAVLTACIDRARRPCARAGARRLECRSNRHTAAAQTCHRVWRPRPLGREPT